MARRTKAELIGEISEAVRGLGADSAVYEQAVADRLGMSSSDIGVLGLLDRRGPMTAGELAEATGLTSGAITGLIDRLLDANLVRRDEDAADRRRVIVTPLRRSGDYVDAIVEPMRAAATEALAGYGVDDLALIEQYITRTSTILREQTASLRGQASGTDIRSIVGNEAHAPRGSLQSCRLELAPSNVAFAVGSKCTEDDLFRARFYDGVPQVEVTEGVVFIRYGRRPVRGRSADLQLNPAVSWELRTRGGASAIDADLTGLSVRSIDVKGGANQLTLNLCPPTDDAQIRIRGGSNKVELVVAKGCAVQVRSRGGLSRLALPSGESRRSAGGSIWQTAGFDSAASRYDVAISGGANALTLRFR